MCRRENTVKGFFDLKRLLPVRKEVLGREFIIKMAGVDVKLRFPRFPDAPSDIDSVTPLVSPSGAEKWKRGKDEDLEWGYIYNYEQGTAQVGAVAIFLTDRDSAPELYNGAQKWEDRLFDYYDLCFRKRFRKAPGTRCGLDLFDKEHIPSNLVATIYLQLHNLSYFADVAQIKEILQYAGSDRPLRAEHEMILSAYDARENNRNRQAVVDACAALELMVIRKVRQLSLTPNEDLENKRMLGPRVSLLIALDGSFPYTYDMIDQDVLKLRNDMMHGRVVYPTNQETDKLINTVQQCLDVYKNDGYCD